MNIDMKTLDFKDLAVEAKRCGRKVVIFDLDSPPSVNTTEHIMDIPLILGEILVLSSFIVQFAAKSKIPNLTEERVLKMVIEAAANHAEKLLKMKNNTSQKHYA